MPDRIGHTFLNNPVNRDFLILSQKKFSCLLRVSYVSSGRLTEVLNHFLQSRLQVVTFQSIGTQRANGSAHILESLSCGLPDHVKSRFRLLRRRVEQNFSRVGTYNNSGQSVSQSIMDFPGQPVPFFYLRHTLDGLAVLLQLYICFMKLGILAGESHIKPQNS